MSERYHRYKEQSRHYFGNHCISCYDDDRGESDGNIAQMKQKQILTVCAKNERSLWSEAEKRQPEKSLRLHPRRCWDAQSKIYIISEIGGKTA